MCLCDSQEKYFWEVSENWPDTALLYSSPDVRMFATNSFWHEQRYNSFMIVQCTAEGFNYTRNS